MKSRIVALLAGLAFVLTACSLAEDITPPPGYVSPTPAPTLGPLHPAAPPSPARGLAIFAQECSPCHGDDGLGNGPMSAQMPVAVPAIALREISSQAAPADWFAIVSQGRIDRGMPGFISLTDAEKWDVLAYVFSLSTTPAQQQRGAQLYAADCTTCHGADGRLDSSADLADPAFMAQETGIGMYRLIAGQSGSGHPFTGQLSEDDLWSLVGYVRSLAFDLGSLAAAPTATATPEAASATPGSAQETAAPGTPAPETSPAPAAQTLIITGSADNASGGNLAPGLAATLHLHDTNTGKDVQTLTVPIASDGSYRFEGVQASTTLAYWVSVDYTDVTYNSQPVVYDGTTLSLETQVPVYESTQDLNALSLDQVHVGFDFSTAGIVQVIEIYVLSNTGLRTVIIPSDGHSIPFIQLPEEASNIQFQLLPGSAPLMSATSGFAMEPSSSQYDIEAFYTLPYQDKLEFSHLFSLAVPSVAVFVPDGVQVQSDLLTDSGSQAFQGRTFHLYQAGNLAAGSTFSVNLSGTPGAGSASALSSRNGLLIGLAAIGLVLIGVGVYLYLRDRARARDGGEFGKPAGADALGEDRDAILDAIIALDDQFKAGGLRKEAYERRRMELRNRLTGK